MHNAQQLQGINSNARTIVMVAGPGSGKTATTVARITRLIHEAGVDPSGIVALTFTNNAARELEERLAKSCPVCDGKGWYTTGPAEDPEQAQCECMGFPPRLGYCGTLHGFALRMLKQHGTALGYGDRMAIIDPTAAADLLQSKADSLGCKMKLADLEKLKSTPRPVGNQITLAQAVISAYYDDLREAGIVDFDIMLAEFLRLLTPGSLNVPHPAFPAYTHLFVDEAQDSSSLDWQIYRALPIEHKFYVGDPDQAIYSFRGGNVREFLDLAETATYDHVKTDGKRTEIIYLETNYRSHEEVCSAANNLIAHNTTRLDKKTTSAKGIGGTVAVHGSDNEGEEQVTVIRSIRTLDAGQTIAILTRTNAIAYEYRQALKAFNIPVKEAPKPEMPKDWQMARAFINWLVQPENDMLAYFYLIAAKTNAGLTPENARKEAHAIRKQASASGLTINAAVYMLRAECDSDVSRILAERGHSLETRMIIAEKMKSLGPDHSILDLALALADTRKGATDEPIEPDPLAVNVTTIHGAKGLEFDCVYIVGAEQQSTPGTRKGTTPEEIEEERRLFYVAITRARKELNIHWSNSRKTEWGKIEPRNRSQFLLEVLG